MKPKRVILCPNPYRDSELKVCKQSRDMLESLGMQTSVCLPFQREGYGEELGIPMRLLQQEIRSADLLIASAATVPFCIWPGPWRCTVYRCWG